MNKKRPLPPQQQRPFDNPLSYYPYSPNKSIGSTRAGTPSTLSGDPARVVIRMFWEKIGSRVVSRNCNLEWPPPVMDIDEGRGKLQKASYILANLPLSLICRQTQIAQRAAATARVPRKTNPPPMKNEQVRDLNPVFTGNNRHQVPLDSYRILCCC